jgi:hypothetical protein
MTARAILPRDTDESRRFTYQVDGSPEESAKLYIARNNANAPMALLPIPKQTLAARDVFVGNKVTLPFDRLSPVVRRQLATCAPPAIK